MSFWIGPVFAIRACSSVGLERVADNDEVPGSNPGMPTKMVYFYEPFFLFDYEIKKMIR